MKLENQVKSQIKKVERIKKNMISKLKIALLQITTCKTLEENLENEWGTDLVWKAYLRACLRERLDHRRRRSEAKRRNGAIAEVRKARRL